MILFAQPDEQVCSVCETLQPCVTVVDDKEQVVIGNICRSDLARALEALTGFSVYNMIENMAGVASLSKRPFTRRVTIVGKEGVIVPELRTSQEGSGPASTRDRRGFDRSGHPRKRVGTRDSKGS